MSEQESSVQEVAGQSEEMAAETMEEPTSMAALEQPTKQEVCVHNLNTSASNLTETFL